VELQDVQFEVQDGVGIITMNRPERLNASSSDMTQGMIHILENLTPDVRAIVLTGAGRAFSAGGDVKGMNESLNNPDGRPAWRRSHPEDVVSVAFWNCDRPIIAAVNGHSVGIGLSYACMCDIRIASDKAQFGALWIRRGFMPDGGGTFFLPFILGVPKALELIWTGDIIDAPAQYSGR
jgi:enoyl-CoA hydratase/carnithine racemase